jgi:hypothetical protein
VRIRFRCGLDSRIYVIYILDLTVDYKVSTTELASVILNFSMKLHNTYEMDNVYTKMAMMQLQQEHRG